MAVETLGRWKNPRVDDGPGRGHMQRNGKETEEKTPSRLSLGKPPLSQLVVLSILPLRISIARQRDR